MRLFFGTEEVTVSKQIRYQVSSDGQINRGDFCWCLLVENRESRLSRVPDARDDVDHVRLVRGVGVVRLEQVFRGYTSWKKMQRGYGVN